MGGQNGYTHSRSTNTQVGRRESSPDSGEGREAKLSTRVEGPKPGKHMV